MRLGFYIVLFETALLLLAFLPYAEEDTTRYIELISYLSLILPLYVAIQRKFWNFISLLSLTAVIHIIRDLCGSFDTCLNRYEELKWDTLDDYFTLYAIILHVMAVVAFLDIGLEILLPFLFSSPCWPPTWKCKIFYFNRRVVVPDHKHPSIERLPYSRPYCLLLNRWHWTHDSFLGRAKILHHTIQSNLCFRNNSAQKGRPTIPLLGYS